MGYGGSHQPGEGGGFRYCPKKAAARRAISSAETSSICWAAVETARQLVGLAERRALFVRTGHHGQHSGEWRDADGAVAALFPQHDNRSRARMGARAGREQVG